MKKAMQKNKRTALVLGLVVLLLVVSVVPMFAQTGTVPAVALELNSADITSNLFTGANIIIGALLAIVMLVAGFKFGRGILDDIVSSITRR